LTTETSHPSVPTFPDLPCHLELDWYLRWTMIWYADLAGITQLSSIPCSKEGNGIVERNIFFDNDVIDEWSSYLHAMEKVFNSYIKHPFGASPNTLVISGLIDANHEFQDRTPTKKIKTHTIHMGSCWPTHAPTGHTQWIWRCSEHKTPKI